MLSLVYNCLKLRFVVFLLVYNETLEVDLFYL